MTITRSLQGHDLMVFTGSGVLTRTEFDESKKYAVAHIKAHGNVRILLVIDEGFVGLEPLVSWHDTQADEFIHRHVSRLAIVGSSKWSQDALLFFLCGLLPFPIQYFNRGDEATAKAWLQAEYLAKTI